MTKQLAGSNRVAIRKKKSKYEHQQCWQHPNGEKANQGVRMRERNSI